MALKLTDSNTPIPKSPLPLTSEERKVYKDIAAHLRDLNLLANIDGYALAQLAKDIIEVQELDAIIKIDGRTFTSDKGYQQVTPSVTLREQLLKRIATAQRAFGMNPVGRKAARTAAAEKSKANAQNARSRWERPAQKAK